MKALAITAVLLAATPAAAQFVAPNGQRQIGPTANPSAQRSPASSAMDVICNELIAGTFCTSGRSSGQGYGTVNAGTSANAPSLPACTSDTPANELCN